MSTLLLAIFLFSCEKEVDLDLPEYERKLVIDGRIEPGIPPIIILTHSHEFFGETDLQNLQNNFAKDAKIVVSDGTTSDTLIEICTDNLPFGLDIIIADFLGVEVSEVPFLNICFYSTINPGLFGQVGKNYDLWIEYEGQEYTSDTKIPDLVPLDTLYYKEADGQQGYGFTWAVLSDPDTLGNGYRWSAKRTNLDSSGEAKDPDYKNPFGFSFYDEFINGETFDFAYERPPSENDEVDDKRAYYRPGDTIVVRFSTCEREIVNFLRAAEAQILNNGSPFASPSNIPTNIEGGALGLWAGYGITYDTTVAQ